MVCTHCTCDNLTFSTSGRDRGGQVHGGEWITRPLCVARTERLLHGVGHDGCRERSQTQRKESSGSKNRILRHFYVVRMRGSGNELWELNIRQFHSHAQ